MLAAQSHHQIQPSNATGLRNRKESKKTTPRVQADPQAVVSMQANPLVLPPIEMVPKEKKCSPFDEKIIREITNHFISSIDNGSFQAIKDHFIEKFVEIAASSHENKEFLQGLLITSKEDSRSKRAAINLELSPKEDILSNQLNLIRLI